MNLGVLVFTNQENPLMAYARRNENDKEETLGSLTDIFPEKWLEIERHLQVEGWKVSQIYEVQKQLHELRIQGGIEKDLSITEVPSKELVDFSKELNTFKNTHAHLKNYENVKSHLGLNGENYYSIEKAMTYLLESISQKTITFEVDGRNYDNRMHLIVICPAGKGKGQIKSIAKLNKNYADTYATRINIEQLIGKRIKTKKTEVDNYGYLANQVFISDESNDLLNESDGTNASIMHELRTGLDIYGENTLKKKMVDNIGTLELTPPFRHLCLTHPIIFCSKFFDAGTFRRYFAIRINPIKLSEDDLLKPKKRIEENSLYDYANSNNSVESFEISPLANNFIKESIKTWSRFIYLNPNQRVRMAGKGLEYAIKIHFYRMVAILGISKRETKASLKTAQDACIDTYHLLLETIQTYANNSKSQLSRDIWMSEDENECALFEWMHHNGAVNEKETPLSIYDIQQKIGDIFGIHERQSISRFSNMVRRGLIGRSKGKDDSKAWLTFTPNLDSPIDFGEAVFPDLVHWIECGMKGKTCETCRVSPTPLDSSIRTPTHILLSSSFSMEEKKGGGGVQAAVSAPLDNSPKTAPLAPLDYSGDSKAVKIEPETDWIE